MADLFGFIDMLHWVMVPLSYFSWAFPGVLWLHFMSEPRTRIVLLTSQNVAKISV